MPTVVVGCKLPNGLHMDLEGRRFTLKGTAVPWGVPPVITPGGYALTPDVDEEFANEWFRRNAGLTMVEKKIVYIAPKAQDARAMAREFSDVRTGLEPRDPDSPGPGLEQVRPGS